jgi:transposase
LIAPKVSKTRFEKIYRFENDANVKERMLLVLNVVYEKQIPAQVARDLHRSRTWASDWLKRYREEGIEGLKNRTKSGRPPDIPEETVYEIKNELASSKQGRVDYKTGRRSNSKKEWWNQIPLYTYLQTHA